VLAPSLALVAILLTSCTPASARERLELDDVAVVSTRLHCDNIQTLKADMAFYDDMRGINCFFTDKQTVLLRAYQHDASLGQVLPDLAPTISAENQIIVGQNWYATGSPVKLRELAQKLDAPAPEPTLTVKTSPTLSSEHEALGMCSAYVTSVIHTYVFEPAEVPALTDGSEDAYPGILGVIERVGDELKAENVSTDTFDAMVTTQASAVRGYCAKIYG
jgi:hypothetical protein